MEKLSAARPLCTGSGRGLVRHRGIHPRDKPETARRWIQSIREMCETLATQPEMGELRKGFGVPGCRSFSVGNYVIFFRQADDGIEIARIVHGNRDMRNI